MIDDSNVGDGDDDSLLTNDEDNDSCLRIADLLLLIVKKEKHNVDMSTINFWNNSCQCYLTLHDFRSDTYWITMMTIMTMMTQSDSITIDDDKD